MEHHTNPYTSNPASLAEDYTRSTKVPCFYLSLEDGIEANQTDTCLQLLRCIDSLEGQVRSHSDLHRFATYQAERYGGKYFYLCSLSLLHWASPIIHGGMLVGAMIAGPVLLFEPDALFIEELQHNLGLDERNIDPLYRSLKTLEVVSTTRAGSLSQLLFLASLSVSDNNVRHLFDEYGGYEHQCRIGEYLHLLKTMENDSHSDIPYPLEKEKELLRLTAEGNREGAKRILEELMAVIFFTTGIALDMVKSRVLELIVLLSRAAMEGGADVEQIFGLNYHYLNRIRAIGTLEELSTWTIRIMERFTDIVFDLRSVRHTHAIIQAIRHVKGHYREKVVQAEVAKMVGLSPQYFSNLFKLEMHITFSEYVTKVRIEQAKRKLLESSTSVGDIAFECGFEDQSYFTKVFAKAVGIVPSRYRMTGGRVIK